MGATGGISYMRILHVFVVAVLCIAPVAIAKPTKPMPPMKAKMVDKRADALSKLKVANGRLTNWGTMDLGGVNFELTGHAQWDAFATVRDDGRIKVTWTFKSDGRVAPGLYTVEPDGTMIGIWGYGDQVQWEANGELTGRVSPDRIYAMPTPEPDFK